MDHGTATACQRHKSDILFKKILERNEMFRSVSIHTQLPPLPFRLSLIIFLNSYNDINYEYNWTHTFMINCLFINSFWKNLRNWEMDRQYWEIGLTYNHICCNQLTRISYLVYNWDKSNTHRDSRYPLKNNYTEHYRISKVFISTHPVHHIYATDFQSYDSNNNLFFKYFYWSL